jgi:8-oxoguanine deaminase
MERVLIKNADWVITMDSGKRRLKNCDILIEGNVIAGIGQDVVNNQQVDKTIEAEGKVVIPGFVNTHHHCWQSLVRNIHIANGLTLEPWLKIVYDIFQEVTPDVVRAGAYVGLGELLKTGCTTSMDHHYVFPRTTTHNLIDAEIEVAQQLGIRFHPTRGSMTIGQSEGSPHVPDSLTGDIDEILADSERLIQKYHDSSKYSMLRIGLAPCWHGLDSKAELMTETLKLARNHGVQCHSHLAESRAEITTSIEKLGCRPVEYLARLGWLGEDIYYAHCVQLNDEEVKLLAETGTGVAHCPASNMFLNSGVCRVPALLEEGGKVGLGVDGAASNNASNMMSEIRLAYLVHQLTWGNRGLTPEQILEISTVGGAKVLGRDDIGYLAPGMSADLVLMDWNQLQYSGGKNDPVACIVLSGDSKMVDTVLVNGKIAVQKGCLINIDEAKVTDWVNRTGKGMLSRAAERQEKLKADIS